MLNSSKDALIFQQLDVDHYIGEPFHGMPGAQTGSVPIMRMFGITKEGNSICCHIHGFSPYFYVSVPETFGNNDCQPFKVHTQNVHESILFQIWGFRQG